MIEAESLFTNDNLKSFITSIDLNSEQKKRLLLKVPQLDLGERIILFKTLNKIYLLNIRKEEAIEKIKKFWQKQD